MRTVPVFEAKNRLSELLHAVEMGEEITITRHGQAVARLVASTAAHSEASQRASVSAAMSRLRQLRQTTSLGDTLHQAINTGRD